MGDPFFQSTFIAGFFIGVFARSWKQLLWLSTLVGVTSGWSMLYSVGIPPKLTSQDLFWFLPFMTLCMIPIAAFWAVIVYGGRRLWRRFTSGETSAPRRA